ncbi:hypothetical protein B0A48_06653 [Cryoendolithus antarcticus]|uniref:Uncharacterized protein n=1 Tax=Cryoendolithus antarcticus TaxID=1507870 RepID=A0A1V8T9J7_9PEZI|nr:hypothetical protein B0A48_06653 [Cryoendolithus antarcticus]
MARLATGEWTKTKDALLVIISAFVLIWLTGPYVDNALYDLQQAWTTPIVPYKPEPHVFRPLDAGLEVTSILAPEPFREGNYTSSTLSQRRTLFSRANDPGGDNPANRDAFQMAITKGQSLLCRLADASGPTVSPYTALDNLKDWGYDSVDITVQATNTYANTWLAFFQKHNFNIRNQPGQNHLGAFQPTGYNLETSYKHARNTTHDGTTYHATGAEFKNTINVHDGVIIAHHNFGPDFTSKNVAGQSLGFPPGSPIVKLKRQSQTTVDTRKNLKFVLRDHIVNPDTTTIIAQALKSAGYAHTVPPVWPGVTFTSSDDEGKQAAWEALIAAPNVQGVAWLLIQHFEAMGRITIKSITVSDQANGANHKDTGSFSANMVIELGEREAPATPPRLARRGFGDDPAKDLKTYQDYTSKGQRLLCNFDDPEGGQQTTWMNPAAIESWGWTKSPSFNSPQGNNLEVQYKHDRTTTHDGVQYPATGGEFTDTYNVKDGVLIASVNFGPLQASKGWRGQNAQFPPGGAITKFKNWSDGIYLTWKSMTNDQTRSNLKFVIRQSVVNENTLSVIASAMKSTGHSDRVPPAYPGTTFTRSTTDATMQTAFEALVGTPNVSGIVWLLVQHWEAMGKKTIKSITVMDATNPMMAHLDTFQAHIIVELAPASESSSVCTQFRDILASSPKLREKCWLRLPMSSPDRELERWVHGPVPGAPIWHRHWIEAKVDDPTQGTFVPVRISPFFGGSAGASNVAQFAYERHTYVAYNKVHPMVKAAIHGRGSTVSILNIYICEPLSGEWLVTGLFVTLRHSPPLYAFLQEHVSNSGRLTIGEILERVFEVKAWSSNGPSYDKIPEEHPERARQRKPYC